MQASYYRPTRITVDLSAIKENIELHKQKLALGQSIFAVVKADAYGHGVLPVAKAAIEAGAVGFCVATLDEALELRTNGFLEPIIVLGPIDYEGLKLASEYEISIPVVDLDYLDGLIAKVQTLSLAKPLLLHLAIDSGMSRIGIRTKEELHQAEAKISAHSDLVFEGIFTHFSTADQEDDSYFKHKTLTVDGKIGLTDKFALNYGAKLNFGNEYTTQGWEGEMLYKTSSKLKDYYVGLTARLLDKTYGILDVTFNVGKGTISKMAFAANQNTSLYMDLSLKYGLAFKNYNVALSVGGIKQNDSKTKEFDNTNYTYSNKLKHGNSAYFKLENELVLGKTVVGLDLYYDLYGKQKQVNTAYDWTETNTTDSYGKYGLNLNVSYNLTDNLNVSFYADLSKDNLSYQTYMLVDGITKIIEYKDQKEYQYGIKLTTSF